MGRLTERVANAAKKPAKDQVLIRDGELRGFALRVTSNGCKTWVWDGRIHGQMRRITIGRYPDLSPQEARAEALRIRHEIAVGHDPAEKRQLERAEPALAKQGGLYLDLHAKQRKRSWPQDQRRLRLHFRSLASLKLSYINRAAVSRWHDRIGTSPDPLKTYA